MGYVISQSELESVWQVVFSGRVDAESFHTAVNEELLAASRNNIKGILVDFRQANAVMSTMEAYELGKRVASMPEFRTIRIVFLYRSGKELDGMFLETVAANRGIPISIYKDRDKAMKWLSGRSRGGRIVKDAG
ncbi:hypothetical protein GF321_00740 [bacterium]|nr:hypothetical protein [bacterium]